MNLDPNGRYIVGSIFNSVREVSNILTESGQVMIDKGYATDEDQLEYAKKYYFEGKPLVINFKPLNNQILVKEDKEEEKSSGGIIFINPSQDPIVQGTVIAMADIEYDTEVEVGQKVLINRFSGGQAIKLEGEEYVLVPEPQIVAIVG